jgi:hypothetical protein
VLEKERVATMNDALSRIIDVARPFFKRRSGKTVKKLNNKKSVSSLQQDTQEERSDNYEYNEDIKKDF